MYSLYVPETVENITNYCQELKGIYNYFTTQNAILSFLLF